MASPVYFGVRHLSPAAAHYVHKELDRVQPDIVLIEGPADLTEQMHWFCHPQTKLPAAILAYTQQTPIHTLLYPFAEYSPEYQAILWANKHKVPCRFMDLPSSVMLAIRQSKEEEQDQDQPQKEIQGRTTEEVYQQLETLLGESHDTFWERKFEQLEGNYLEAAAEFGKQLRQSATDPAFRTAENLVREAYMKRCIQQAQQEGKEKIFCVCGAYHVEGLEQNYWVDGSENSLWIKLLNFQLNNTLTAMDSLQETFKAIPEDHAAKRAEVAHAWDSVVNKQINFSKEFILKHAVSPASYYALYQKFNDNSFILDPIEDLHSYKIVASSLKAMYPESQYTKAILQHLDQISNSIQNERIRRIIDNADSNLPAISLPNASGDTIALSDLRGKYIILDFNVLGAKESEGYTQELKKVYNKFRNRGVEIYQVCLDNNQLLWSRLVKQYGITWQCVRDPQGLQSRVAQTWNVQTVPANYIINPKFEIVGKNLTGARLEERLNDLMKQR